MLSIKKLTIKEKKNLILDNISLNILKNEITLLLSDIDFLSYLIGENEIYSGSVTYYGYNIKNDRNLIMMHTGYHRFSKIKDDISLDDYFKYLLSFYKTNNLDYKLLFDMFSIDTKKELYLLTDRENQIRSIIEAIVINPETILLTKPFMYLNENDSKILIKLLKEEKNKDKIIVILDDVLDKKIYDKIYILNHDSAKSINKNDEYFLIFTSDKFKPLLLPNILKEFDGSYLIKNNKDQITTKFDKLMIEYKIESPKYKDLCEVNL